MPRVCCHYSFVVAAVAALALPAGFQAIAHAFADGSGEKTYEVEKVKDIAYYEGKDADKKKHKLDLYLPKDQKDFPVVMFVHGGAWSIGSKDVAWHADVGKFFAAHGIGAVSINYRLSSPGGNVQHPEHIKDVARAFAWTQKNIKKHGGRPDQIFIAGHSAGGHLVALLATDESYLKAEGCSLKDIKGVLPISGVFDVQKTEFAHMFGDDVEVRKKASPINQVNAGVPPFLILYADKDLAGIPEGSEAFCKALKDKKANVEILKLEDRNHMTILLKGIKDGDPCGKAMLDFIKEQTKK